MEVRILQGDVASRLGDLPDESVHCVVTSPPYYGLRDYGVEGQIGLEKTPEEYVRKIIEVFRQVKRVLRNDGTLWLNLGDSYAGSWGAQSRPNGNDIKSTLQGGSSLSARQIENHPRGSHTGSVKNTPGLKPKDLIGIPWKVAFALQADGWYLRQDIIWSKPNPMPESVKDRCTKSHEYIFMLSKSEKYYYDQESIKEPASFSTEERKNRSHNGQKGMTAKKINVMDPVKIPSGWDTDKGSYGSIHKDGRTKSDKQRGHSRRHAGFNERWDHMTKGEQCSGMRNKRSVWTIATQPFPDAHFATYPEELIRPCVLAGCPTGGTVLDPFGGAGTTAIVAMSFMRNSILIEINPAYIDITVKRIKKKNSMFDSVIVL